MSVVVHKYGGSSLADLDRLDAVADKIVDTYREGQDVVAVVSAMGDTTDELLDMARELDDEPSRRELDMLLSVGERIAMSLLSIAIQRRGVDAVSLTGSQCGIITTHNHSDARIMDVRPFRVRDELEMDKVVIVAGYQGTSYRREVTTLGRGGSDTTAVALAAALDAKACEIFSDVEGIYSADPGTVVSADQLMELSHDEMLEMARSGARVLHEEAVAFARKADIALYARKAHGGDSGGTVVRKGDFERRVERAERGLPAVNVSQIDEGLWATAEADASNALLAAVDDHRLAVCNWRPGAFAEIFLGSEDVHGLAPLESRLDGLGEGVAVRRAGLVSLIGQGIGREARWAVRGRRTLNNEADVETRAVGFGNNRLSWVVDSEDLSDAASALHDRFVLEDPGEPSV